MQDQVGESFSLDWIEREEFGQEFEEVWIDWSTKIAPLWSLNLYNISLNTSFDFPFAFHCLQSQATTTSATTTTTCFRILSCETLNQGQTTRLHNK